MKKLLIVIGLALALLTLVCCSGTAALQKIESENVEDTLRDQKTTMKPEESGERTIVAGMPESQNADVKPKDLNDESEGSHDSYTFSHEKDSTAYTVTVMHDSDYNYTLQLFDAESNKLQSICLESRIFAGIDFMDVNLDGYTDIVVNTGGTLNETHDLYIWEVSSENFIKVIFEGFDMLYYFEVYEGYIMNWAKDTAYSGVVQKLVWNESTLKMESEESYELKD